MSRSRRHTPVIGITTSESDKWWKRWIHGKRRTAERLAIAGGNPDDLLTATHQPKDGYGAKDGKQWLRDPTRDNSRYMRK